MNLMYLVFGGNSQNHSQANFSILTFLAQEQFLNKIIVLTDTPDFYNSLNHPKVQIEKTTTEEMKDWQGDYNYFWRVKIKAVEKIALKYPEDHLLYLDSDTFLFGDLSKLAQILDQGHSIMHLKEGPLSSFKTKSKKTLWNELKGKSIQDIEINQNSAVWNAGVIGISQKNLKTIPALTLSVCDELCQSVKPNWLIEQFSFSIVLNHLTELHPSQDSIAHYWGNKNGWNDFITQFFTKAFMNKLSIQQTIQAIKNVDWKKVPIHERTSQNRKRLLNFVDLILPKSGIKYLNDK